MRKILTALFVRRVKHTAAVTLTVFLAVGAPAGRAAAQDQLYFSSNTDVTSILVNYINQETVRLDISSWYLSEHAISIAIANRWAAGVPVRIIGDRAALFENDPHTKAEFYWLANQGIPIRLRFNPTWFPEIDHWKAAIFVGQNLVEFGSGNFAPTELAPVSSTNFDDDSEMFTTDPALVGAFLTKFDVMWNDTTTEPHSIISGPPYLKDWNDACANEPTGNCADYATQYPNPAPMVVNTARLEPDNPMPADLYWGQGTEFDARMVQEVNNETSNLEIIIYRLEVADLTQALLNKFQAGVPVRMIVDPAQYTDNAWPEYWLTHANVDRLYAAGVPILQRTHQGVTHIKTLITSNYATNASSNFAPNWQRDNDYFVANATKPDIYAGFVNRFSAMWADATNFGPFVPTPPNAVDTSATGTVPSPGQSGVSVATTFTWNTASWATSYDLYLGTSPSSMTVVANVPAQLVQNPPTTYSWTPSSALAYSTTYYWKVVSRTFAGLTASSSNQVFSTPAAGSQPPTTPANPAPATGTSGVGNAPTLTWSSAGASSYAINFGTANPPPATGTSTNSPSYSPGTLSANRTYYWQIVASNSAGSTTGPIWSFATSASNLPSPWQSQDVGATGQTGSSILNAGTFTISGAGADIWGTSDGFQFAYQTLSGNGTITARVTSMQNTSANAKAGVMLRTSVDAGSAHVILDLNPSGNIEFMSRPTTGASTSWLAGATQAAPVWLQLALTGSTVTGSISPDGQTWTQVGSTTISFPSTIDAGLVVNSHDTSTLNTATFDGVSIANTAAPGAPGSPAPANAATGISTSPTLTWTAAGATSYDVAFGQSSSPALVSTGQSGASYSPGTLTAGTTYVWQITAHNAAGATAGPAWSFTTAPAPSAPSVPGTPSPGSAATGVATAATLTWSSSGATSYDVSFGPSNPPAQVSTGQTGASYAPASLTNATTYYWQIVAHNGSGTTTGPVWSFTTTPATPNTDIVIYASDVTAANTHGMWAATSDPTSPNSVKLATPVTGWSTANAPVAAPADYFDATFTASAGTPYTLWLRLQATNNSKSSDSVWVQFSDAQVNGSAVYPIGSTSGLLVKLASDSTAASDNAWGWVDGAYWLSQPATVTFPTTGTHTVRVQVRYSGVQVDQIVLSPATYFNAAASCPNTCAGAPGPFTNDHTIVPKPTPPAPPAAPASPSPANAAANVSTTPTLTWSASGATTYDVNFGTSNPPASASTGQSATAYTPSALANSTTYFWQIVAHNSAGATTGPVWSFTTAAAGAPPSAPASPQPSDATTNVVVSPTLSWSATGATTYDVNFGTANPPALAAGGMTATSYTPSPLANGTTYFWQIVAHNANGSTTGPVWSFTTAAAPSNTDVVIYASDIPTSALHGSWAVASDPTSPNGTKLVTPDNGWSSTDNPLAAPTDYVDVTFTANAGTPYRLWLRMQALADSKYNDSLWVQFSDASASGSSIYPMNTTSGLDVNLATDATGSSDQAWGWQNTAYWLSQPTTFTFATSGTHTMRIQVREDGVEFDQIVLSQSAYLTAAPGAVSNDSTIVPKP